MSDLFALLEEQIPSVDRCAKLLSELVSYYSPPGKEHAVQQAIADWFAVRGIKAEIQTVQDGLLNVIATVQGAGHGPTLLLCGHVDTVLPAEGWSTDPTTPTIIGDRLYGLGAVDMKTGVAAGMLALEALHHCRERW